MKKLFIIFIFLMIINSSLFSQTIKYLGLPDKHITSLKIGEGIIAAGTKFNGVFWQTLYQINDSSWNKIDIDSVNVTSVYPHKSGPIGWAIGIGTEPTTNDTNYIYCSYLGNKPTTISYGIDEAETKSIDRIDGFPDPTICGETFAIGGRKLYRRYFTDTVWHPVYNLTIEGSFESLKAREEFAEVYAGGVEGFAGMLLIRTKDKGETWENLSPLCPVADLDFWDANDTTILVTDRYRIMRSMDNGRTWNNVYQTDSLTIQKISFNADGKIVYMVSNSKFYNYPRSYLSYTYDFGENWITTQLPIYDIIAGMEIDSDGNIYVAYINDGLYKISPSVVNVDEQQSKYQIDDFRLYNNYPNPFNPSTIIKYQLPVNSFVSLKILNSVGEEIKTLVNDYQTAGLHSEFFTADSRLPSGVYFYELKAGNFLDTKKMILLK